MRTITTHLAFASILLLALGGSGCGTADNYSANPDAPDGGEIEEGGVLPDGGLVDGALPDGAPSDVAVPDGSPSSGDPYTSQVKIIVEPSDDAQALITAIQSANMSVHVTMYLLTNNGVIAALIGQKQAKHEVKVVLNQNFPFGQNGNAATYSQLKNAGVDVVYAPSGFTFTHEKTVIIDSTSAWIMTMNATDTSPSQNREYLAIDTDAQDVSVAEQIFQADYTNTALSPNTKLVVAPTNARDRLVQFLAGAKASIDLESEELSDTQIVNALAARADSGVKVRIVLSDASPSPAQKSAVTTLKQHKIPVVTVSNPYIHAKAAVVDGSRAYVGSANFTTVSLTSNRELGVLFDASAEVAKVGTTIGQDFASGTPM